jgi:hypothetical protein
MHKLTIPGQLISLNEYIRLCRANKYSAAKKKKDIEDMIILNIKTQLKRFKTEKKIFLEFYWYEKRRNRDPDNISFAKKFLLDSLVKSGTIPNDGWSNISGFTDQFFIDKTNPRVEVVIKECTEDD